MASKIGRMTGHAVAIEVVRGSAEAVVLGQQRTGDQRLILRAQGADGGIESLLHQIDPAGGELQIQIQLGVAVEKSGQQRHQPVVAKAEGAAMRSRPAGSASRFWVSDSVSASSSSTRWQRARESWPSSVRVCWRVVL